MISIMGWPFLVSRNRDAGYRTVVAPLFMERSDAAALLADAAGGDITDVGTAMYREILGASIGDLFLVYRVEHARGRDIGLDDQEPLRDQQGRLIVLIEGLVLREWTADMTISDDDLARAHSAIQPAYRDFWLASDTPCPLALSQQISLSMAGSAAPSMALRIESPLKVAKSIGNTSQVAERQPVGPLIELGKQQVISPPDPAVPAPTRPRVRLRLAVALAGVLAVGLGIVLSLKLLASSRQSVPGQMLGAFCVDVRNHDYTAAGKLIDEKDAATKLREILQDAHIVDCAASKLEVGTETAQLRLTAQNQQRSLIAVKLINLNGWRIDNSIIQRLRQAFPTG
jgi:hypothetical protein